VQEQPCSPATTQRLHIPVVVRLNTLRADANRHLLEEVA